MKCVSINFSERKGWPELFMSSDKKQASSTDVNCVMVPKGRVKLRR